MNPDPRTARRLGIAVCFSLCVLFPGGHSRAEAQEGEAPVFQPLRQVDELSLVAFVVPDRSAESLVPVEVTREMARLNSPDPAVRIQGIKRLRDMGTRAAPAVGTLAAMLDDEAVVAHSGSFQERVASEALDALARIGRPAVGVLRGALKSDREETRARALDGLARIADPAVMEPLCQALQDPAWRVRSAAAEKLGWMRDPRAVEPLIAALEGESQIAAPKDTPPNVATFQHSVVRAAVVRALGRLGDRRAFEPLMTVLEGPDRFARAEAAEALAAIGDRRAVEPLIATLMARPGKVRIACAQALGETRDPRAMPALRAALKSSSWHVRRMVTQTLQEMGEGAAPAIPELIAMLGEEQRMYNGSNRVEPGTSPQWALVAIGKPAVEPLIAALQHPDQVVRQHGAKPPQGFVDDPPDPWGRCEYQAGAVAGTAACALAKIGDARAVEPLIAEFKKDQNEYPSHCAEALAARKDPRIAEAMLAILREKERPGQFAWRRASAAYVLGQVGDARAVEPLLSCLKEKDSQLASTAARALARLNDRHATDGLIAALKAGPAGARRWVAEALGSSKDPRAAEALAAALGDKDAELRLAAALALAELHDGRALEPLLADVKQAPQSSRWRVCKALAKLGDGRAARPVLAIVRASDQGWEDFGWMHVLGKIKDPRAVPLLIAMLDEEPPEDPDRRWGSADSALRAMLDHDQVAKAAWALGEIGAPAVEPLVAALEFKHWTAREAAANALATIGARRAVVPLVAALRDEQWAVRAAAAKALGPSGTPGPSRR